MKNLNYIDRSEEWYNLKYNSTIRFYIKATKPNFNTTYLLVKKVWIENDIAIIYLVKPERLKQEYLRIEILKNAAVEYDSQTYFNWFYPQIRECLYILVKFNIKSYVEIDNIFDRINEEIKSKIKRR